MKVIAHKPQDIKDVSEWLNTSQDKLHLSLSSESISPFLPQILEMEDSFDEFPRDRKRTDKIVKLLRSGKPALPIYVEKGDFSNFMKGRHRMTAFYLVGMKTILVCRVSK